ncbi:MAG TPA: alpha-L-arabinofuranosidase, partial [Chloroflexaceae bacterium]|nr:alpha-L-arabinofuranosidase [Chloroflexaceae bacterium]
NVPAWLNTDGLANETLVRRAAAAGFSVLRLPGGSWSNEYRWLACETERADPCAYAARPSDFIALLKAVGGEAMWTVSFNETAEEAAALVAFFNGEVNDERPIGVDPRGVDWQTVGYWARLRADTGHPAPVGVRLWEVGNEVYGGRAGMGKDCADYGWEETWTCDGTEYVMGKGEGAERRQGFLEFREVMRAVDPSIMVGAVGIPFQREWNNWGNEVIAGAGQAMDFYVIHQYAFFDSPRTPEAALAQPHGVWAQIAEDARGAFERHTGGRQVPIAVTEYNLFSFQDNDTGRLMTRAVNMLHMADTIGQLATHGFAMANQWNLANGVTEEIGNYGMLDAGSLERYPQYYAFPLWARFGGELLPVSSSFDPARELSVYAGRDAEGRVALLVINKAPGSRTATIGVEGVGAVTGGMVDVAQAAALDALKVTFNGLADPADDLADAPSAPLDGVSKLFTYTFTPMSLTLLRLDVTQ